MVNKNILVLLNVYNERGGASVVAVSAGRYYKDFFKSSYIACNNSLKKETLPDDILVLNTPEKIKRFVIEKEIGIVHYFLSQYSFKHGCIFNKYLKAIKDLSTDIRVVTTVCQQPGSPIAPLKANVIENSDYIVFIDKTAYSDKKFSFIPEVRKDWMYLSPSCKSSPYDEYVKEEYSKNNDCVIFGRGSTLNKCPRDTIAIYDKINVPCKKKFIIIGCPQTSNWLSKKVEGRADIFTHPILTMEKYAKKCAQMDVFLYYLPKDAYSSIDGSLGTAMRMGVPVIVYGPQAPKERIIHGVNGFIAETKNEIVRYSELLASDANLRETMGKAARKSILDRTPTQDWKDRHIEIICEVLCSSKLEPVKCPSRIKCYIVLQYLRGAYSIIKSKILK